MAWGGTSGNSDFSYAYAGPDGMVASAGPGGHAVAVSGSGSRFEAKIMGPEGQIIHRRTDGSTVMGKITYSDKDEKLIGYRENQEAMMYGHDNHRAIRNSDENHRATRSIVENHGTTRYDVENQRAITYSE